MVKEENPKGWGNDYMHTYAEIPLQLIKDQYLASKKLGGHRRLFSPGSPEEIGWFNEHRSELEQAYGSELVNKFFENNFVKK